MAYKKASYRKFVVVITVFQVAVAILFTIFVRYDRSIDPKFHTGNETVADNFMNDYSLILDIQVMLFVGFGFLMTFLRRFGYSAVCFTMLLIVFCVEYAILVKGFTSMEGNTIYVDWYDLLDGGFAAATTLVSFGVVIGKTTPMQLLGLAFIEVPLWVLVNYIGYEIIGAIDVGGAIFIHTFGAYFGLIVSLVDRQRDYNHPFAAKRSGSDHTTDLFSILGTLMLLIYWPSFNGILAPNGEGKHRATFNTYLALCASTMTTFLFSAFLGDEMKMNIVDAQNACLSGGVAVGAIADLVLQPYGVLIIGSVAGMISTIGYQLIQNWLQDVLNLHDSCGVHNLHGMPGIFSSLLSALFSGLASEEIYGAKLYQYFPNLTPDGVSYTTVDQVYAQLMALGITLALAVGGGILTGLIINNSWIFHRLEDHQMFEDGYFFNLSNFDDDFEQASMIDGVVGSIPNLKFEALAAASLSSGLNNAESSNPINRRSFDSASNNRRPSKPDLPLTERVGFPFTVEANGVDNVKYPQTRRFSSLDATNKAW